MELPRALAIRESSHRIINPFDATKLATLGRALGVERDQQVLDLACGKGEMLCTWARDHDIVGTGVDINPPFVAAARARASELGVSDRITFLHDDATNWVSTDPVHIAACLGATWIGGGVPGTIELLRRSLRPGGMILVGEPYWRAEPPDQETVEGCHVTSRDTLQNLPGIVRLFGEVGYDLVEMVLARAGYVVAAPRLPQISVGTSPLNADGDLALLRDLISWLRSDWSESAHLAPSPATGLAGHSFGAGLAGRLAGEGNLRAFASLSGSVASATRDGIHVPKLFVWGSDEFIPPGVALTDSEWAAIIP